MTRTLRTISPLLALPLIIFTGGCAARMIGSGPHPVAELRQGEPGMVYYLAKDVLHVQGTATHVTSGEVTVQDVTRRNEAGKKVTAPHFIVKKMEPTFVSSDVSFRFAATVDSHAFYRLETRPGWFRKSTQTMQLMPNGVLESIDARGEGQSGAALAAVARVAAGAATFAGALGTAPQVPTADAKGLETLPLREQYFYACKPAALEWRSDMARLSGKRQALLDGQVALAAAAPQDVAGAVLRERVAAYEKALEVVERDLAAASGRLQREMHAFFVESGLAESTVTHTTTARFELADIPPHERLPAPSSHAAALKELGNDYGKMAACLKDLRFLITLDGDFPGKGEAGHVTPKDESAIFYRMPTPALLRVYRQGDTSHSSRDGAARELQLTEIRDVALLHPDVPATPLPSHPSLWTTRRASLKLDANHRPKELSWESGAVVTDATVSVAEALSDMRKEAVTTAEQAAEFRDNLRDARLAGLQDDIEKLTMKRERLEAQIDLQGAVATADQRLALIRLTAQADLLETQADMEESRRVMAGED